MKVKTIRNVIINIRKDPVNFGYNYMIEGVDKSGECQDEVLSLKTDDFDEEFRNIVVGLNKKFVKLENILAVGKEGFYSKFSKPVTLSLEKSKNGKYLVTLIGSPLEPICPIGDRTLLSDIRGDGTLQDSQFEFEYNTNKVGKILTGVMNELKEAGIAFNPDSANLVGNYV